MDKEYFEELAGYIIWADQIAIDWLQQINDAQWEQTINSSFSSIRQTAVHIASAERVWLDYWTKNPNPVYLSAVFKGSKMDFIALWKNILADLANLTETYSQENYHQPVTFQWPKGGESTFKFWQTFSHFINHATYHRGQLVTLLRQVGFTKLSSTDLATYYRVIHE